MGNTGNLTAVFLQARLDSSRLPKKALLRLGGKTVIELAMEALKQVDADVHVLVTDDESFPVLKEYADTCSFDTFSGPRDDVLARYVLASREYGASTIIRATGDNPLVSWELADRILARHTEQEADYSGFLGIPLGTGVEAVECEALEKAYRDSQDRYEREHVCPYIYRRKEMFTVYTPEIEPALRCKEGRVTLDTQEDYRILLALYNDLYRGGPIPIEKTVAWLKTKQKHFASHPLTV